jgi:2-oxoglutarate dehydrogenase E2 component (dihydrolipoamide succinyltransferase)
MVTDTRTTGRTGLRKNETNIMATEIRVPTLGESVSEATIGTWFKKVGDTVKVDEPLVELETDKVSIEVPSPVSGTLSEILAKDGETVEVNALLAQIAEGEGAAAPAKAETKTEAKSEAPAAKAEAPAAPAKGGSDMPAAPSAQKLMAETRSTPETCRVRASAVRCSRAMCSTPSARARPRLLRRQRRVRHSSEEDAPREERVKMTRLRQTIARRLKEAQNTAAMLTTYNEVDMSAVMDLRSQYKDLFEKKHGVKLGFMGFFTKAVTHALKGNPGGQCRDRRHRHHLQELLPCRRCCRHRQGPGRAGGARCRPDGHCRHREGNRPSWPCCARRQAVMADMQGGTFTISNGGVYGSLMSSPILNAPQSGILGMHKIQERPMAVGGQVVIRPMMYLALSYDHRIVDGKEAVTFLVRVKDSLEDPERLVLDL